MNFRRPLLLVTAAFATLASGQEVVAPSPAGEALPPGPRLSAPSRAVLQPETAPETPLIPDPTPSLVPPERAVEKAKETVSKTEAFTQDLVERIRYREVKTRALADRAIVAEWDKANAARTDAQKRAALKTYYKLLYARMLKIDRSLQKLVELKANEAERRLTQAHISPTEVSDNAERSTAGRVFVE